MCLCRVQLGDGSFEINDGDSATTVTVEVSNGPGGGGGVQGFSRHAADLRRFGKDRFVIQVIRRTFGVVLSSFQGCIAAGHLRRQQQHVYLRCTGHAVAPHRTSVGNGY
jgi:hypothetical protein